MAFTKTVWVDDNLPDVTAAQLNRIEQGIADAPHYSPGSHFPTPPTVGGSTAKTNATAFNGYYAPIIVPAEATISGIIITTASTFGGACRAGLFDANGTKVIARNSHLNQPGAFTFFDIPFDAPYVAKPGLYWAFVNFSTNTATYFGGSQMRGGSYNGGSLVVPASITVPTGGAGNIPDMMTY